MESTPRTFFEYLDTTLRGKTRITMLILIVPLVLSFAFPLWEISMTAPQYPRGLSMDIWSYKVVGGDGGQHIQEINTLNHYIGMRTITREELRDLDWIPFALVAMALLTVRAALLGNVRTIIDLSMIAFYVTAVAFGRFVYMLYDFGHHLDPRAPVTIEPFMPVVFGAKKVANFMTYSYPKLGTVLLGLFAGGIWALTLLHLYRGWNAARTTAGNAASEPAAPPVA